MAREFGYQILEVKSCIILDKVEGVFEDYVNTIYDKNLNSENQINKILFSLTFVISLREIIASPIFFFDKKNWARVNRKIM